MKLILYIYMNVTMINARERDSRIKQESGTVEGNRFLCVEYEKKKKSRTTFRLMRCNQKKIINQGFCVYR